MGASRTTGPRLLTGDRPTGPLHLGHYVGTLRNRVRLQDGHDTFVLVADQHMLTTRLDRLDEIERNVREDVLGNLAVGVDPERATFALQSQVPEIAELFLYLSMLVSVPRVQRIPTLKEQLRSAAKREPSYGLLGYPILQAADILVVKGEVVPVGPDQRPHIELARELARAFDRQFGPVFPEPRALVSDDAALPGTDGQAKMSRSLGNTIDLFDDDATIERKVMGMYTDPTRLRPTDPGHVEGNPVFALHRSFNADAAEVAELEDRYRSGRVGDVEVKQRLIDVLTGVLGPIRERRDELHLEAPSIVDDLLADGTARMRSVTRQTLGDVRQAMRLDYFKA